MTGKSRLYYVEELYSRLYNAGIVRKHNEQLLQQLGAAPLLLPVTGTGSVPLKIKRLLLAIKMALLLPKNSLVIFHFPLLAKVYYWLHTLLRWRGVPTAAIIIDIDGLRDNNNMLLKKELQQLGTFTHVIVHNAAMKSFIEQQVKHLSVHTLEWFDYRAAAPGPQRHFSNQVCFAGNFSKAQFVYQLNQLPELEFYLYGENYIAQHNQPQHIFYKGVVPPETLPALAQGSFGLVWDGPSLSLCDSYLQYNNPHKASLYLAAGMPLIVWDKSALAPVVLEKKVGITITTLNDLDKVINNITAGAYTEMQQNAAELGELICRGYHLKKIIRQLINTA
jgi:glycosyltransferase involved in cell wall biosynthesis